MKILSIDVGIKNLAICILETTQIGFEVKFWEVINLCEEKVYRCNCMTKTKKTQKLCEKLAQFYKDSEFFCKTHANCSNYKLPTSNIKNYKKNKKLDELIALCEEYDIKIIEKTKAAIQKQIELYIEKNMLNPISNLNCNSINLIDIGKSIRDYLNRLDVFIFANLDYVLIENQISPIANRMNCIQGMISQYFLMKNIDNILYISAANKLKLFLENKKTTYSERKRLSIQITKNLLSLNNTDNLHKEKVIEMFNKHKKRDDLADSFLQGIWFLSQNSNIIKDLVSKIKME